MFHRTLNLGLSSLVLVLVTSQLACGSKKKAAEPAQPQAPVPVVVDQPIVQVPPPAVTLSPASLLAGNYVLENSQQVVLKIGSDLALTTSMQLPVRKKSDSRRRTPILAGFEFAAPLNVEQAVGAYNAKGHLNSGKMGRRPVAMKILAPAQGSAAAYVDVTISFVVFGDEIIDAPYIPSVAQNGGISQNGVQQNYWDCDDCRDDRDEDDCDDDDNDDHDHDDCDDEDDDCPWRNYEFRDITLRFLRS